MNVHQIRAALTYLSIGDHSEADYPENNNQRDFNAIFSFITGRLPLDYIKHRRMMRAYETLINQDVYNAEEVILIARYDNQNAFGKKFKRTEIDEWGNSGKNIIEDWKSVLVNTSIYKLNCQFVNI